MTCSEKSEQHNMKKSDIKIFKIGDRVKTPTGTKGVIICELPNINGYGIRLGNPRIPYLSSTRNSLNGRVEEGFGIWLSRHFMTYVASEPKDIQYGDVVYNIPRRCIGSVSYDNMVTITWPTSMNHHILPIELRHDWIVLSRTYTPSQSSTKKQDILSRIFSKRSCTLM